MSKSGRRWRNVQVPCPGGGRRWARFNRVGNAACSVCDRRPYDGLGVDYEPKVDSPHHTVPMHTKTSKELS
jgi:hypothetical protein